MATIEELAAEQRLNGAPAFAQIAIGIDGSRADRAVLEQAMALAGGTGSITAISVTWTVGDGPTQMAALGGARAQRALDHARQLTHAHRVPITTELVSAEHTADALIAAAEGHDLLVVGCAERSRAGGIFLGRTATSVLHRAPMPVLVARDAPSGVPFPRRIALATDGSEGSRRAAELTAEIARAHDASVIVAHVGDSDAASRAAMARDASTIFERTGREPVLVSDRGAAHVQIPALAEHHAVSLLVLGSRGRSGLLALGSVSERVAHRAACSVLVART